MSTRGLGKILHPQSWGTYVEIKAAATYFCIPVFYTKATPTGGYGWECIEPLRLLMNRSLIFIRTMTQSSGPGDCRVHLVSLGCALGVVGFIRCHWGALWVSSYSSAVTWFNWVRPWCRRVHLVSLGSLGCGQGVVWFIQSHWYIGVQPGCRQVHLGSLGSLGCALGVLRFILVHLSAPRGSSGLSGVLGSSGVAGCTGVHPERRCVQLGSLGCAQGVVVFIQVCWVFLGAPWGSSV